MPSFLSAKWLIRILALALAAACATGLIRPTLLTSSVQHGWQTPFSMPMAIAARLVFAAGLLRAAGDSRWPLLFRTVGFLMILSAFGLVLIGHDRVATILAWAADLPTLAVRAWLAFGLLFSSVLLIGLQERTARGKTAGHPTAPTEEAE